MCICALKQCVSVSVCVHACMCECGHVPASPSACHLVPSPAVGKQVESLMPSVYLSHGCQEALWVEEACHPEAVGPPFKDPSLELTVPLKQLCEPEPQGAGGPRCLENKDKQQHEQNITMKQRKLSSRSEKKTTGRHEKWFGESPHAKRTRKDSEQQNKKD